MTDSMLYRMIVFTVVMPISGFLMSGNIWLGLLIILTQIPWALKWAEK